LLKGGVTSKLKKKVLLVISSIILLFVLTTGIAVAAWTAPHRVEPGNKLVGMACYGKIPAVNPQMIGINLNPAIVITNPDCYNKINITRIAVLNDSGAVVYEGPFYKMSFNPTNPVGSKWTRTTVTTLNSHETITFPLWTYFYLGDGIDGIGTDSNWPQTPASVEPPMYYTVEISWKPAGKTVGLPLQGYVRNQTNELGTEGNFTSISIDEIQMTNFTQTANR
jgi:hypothetical protein